MSKKNLSESDVIDILNPQTFRSDDADLPQDPLGKARITVTIDDLQPYDRNPRKAKNPKFDEIKASILNRGLDNTPKVTRRSPSEPMMIKDGGNTRLEILHELWAETGDEKYYRIEVDFEPWVNEIDALAGHMAENEQRGDLLFVEKALAAAEMRKLLEQDTDKPLSGRELARQITALGWTLNDGNLTRYEYATRRLISVVPTALWAGLGHPAVRRLRKMDNVYGEYWQARSSGDESDESESFDDIFENVLLANDDESLDFDRIRRDLDMAIGKVLGIDHYTVAVECDALSAGGDFNLPPLPPPEPLLSDTPPSTGGESAKTTPPAIPPGTDTPNSRAAGVTGATTGASDTHTQPNTPPAHTPVHIDPLRTNAALLAREIARGNGLPDELVFYIPKYFGFLVDMPEAPFIDPERHWRQDHLECLYNNTPEKILPGLTWHWLTAHTMQLVHPWILTAAPAGTRLAGIVQTVPAVDHGTLANVVYGDGSTVPDAPMPSEQALLGIWSSSAVLEAMDELRDMVRQMLPLLQEALRCEYLRSLTRQP